MKKGYRATTVEEIARHAGLTKGALYFHFESKEDILFNLVKSISERHDVAIRNAIRPGMSPSEFFRMAGHAAHRCDLADYSDLIEIWIQAIKIPRIKRYIARWLRTLVDVWETHVDSKYATDRKSLRDLGVLTFGLVDGLSIFRIISPGLVDVEAQNRLVRECFDVPHRRRKAARHK
ncbi:MAG: TetR/AcrR family transcriptional regulator [Candidatus Zixiibacteriota bacterium]|nr:MAG: TetR/AcrR family transcriptional regulator [candidate division Zixibacteria bacterium]